MDHDQVALLARVCLAAVLGFLIGWERHVHGSPAGDRTYALVAVGACTLASVAVLQFPATGGQLIGGVVSGIGFLGAGLIFRHRVMEVHGLTSAAGLWVTASLGVVTGIGYAYAAIGLTAIILLLLMWDHVPVLGRIDKPLSPPAEEKMERKGGTDR